MNLQEKQTRIIDVTFQAMRKYLQTRKKWIEWRKTLYTAVTQAFSENHCRSFI